MGCIQAPDRDTERGTGGTQDSFMAIEDFVADCGHEVVSGEIFWTQGGRYLCDECGAIARATP